MFSNSNSDENMLFLKMLQTYVDVRMFLLVPNTHLTIKYGNVTLNSLRKCIRVTAVKVESSKV